MSDWKTRPRIGKVNMKVTTPEEIAPFDAVMAFAVIGDTYLKDYFAQNVGIISAANKPCIAWVQFDPEVYGGINKGAYPKPENDALFKAVDRALFMGGVYKDTLVGMREVYSIMIDMTDNVQTDGKILTGTWVADHIEHVMDVTWDRYKKPVWLYFNKGTFDYYKSKDDTSRQALEGVINRYGVSFPDNSVILSNGYPIDEESPWTNIPFSGEQKWQFWGIGHVNNLYTFLYIHDKKKLYEDLGFVPATEEPPEEPPEETPENPPENADNSIILERLDSIKQDTEDIKRVTDGIAGVQ